MQTTLRFLTPKLLVSLLTTDGIAKPVSPAVFNPLGDLTPQTQQSLAYGVSSDGSVVVGYGLSDTGYQAFRWTANLGMQGLGDLEGGAFQSIATAVSGNGQFITGWGRAGLQDHAYLWNSSTGMIDLETGELGFVASFGHGVNNDGTVVVGYGITAQNDAIAFRWQAATGMVALGDLPGGGYQSYAFDTSADGNVIAGMSAGPNGFEAFRWTAAEGLQSLLSLSGLTTAQISFSQARAISADGATIVGEMRIESLATNEAFRWTAENGLVGLGFLSDAISPSSAAIDVSADGSVIVGSANSSHNTDEAVRWISGLGPEKVSDLLIARGVDLGGRRLTQAQGVSADGTVIVGYGDMDGNGPLEAWWAYLPLPSNGCINSQHGSITGAARKRDSACTVRTPGLLTETSLNRSLQSVAVQPAMALWEAHGNLASAKEIETDLSWHEFQFGLQLNAELKRDVELMEPWTPPAQTLTTRISYTPKSSSFGATVAFQFSNSSQVESRSYENGITPTASFGARSQHSTAVAARASWIEKAERHSFEAFVDFERLEIELSPYSERTGAFPSQFDATTGSSQQFRSGIVHTYEDSGIRLSSSVGAVLRVDQEYSPIFGQLALFENKFEIDAVPLAPYAVELGLNAEWAPYSNTRLMASATSQSLGGDNPQTLANFSLQVIW